MAKKKNTVEEKPETASPVSQPEGYTVLARRYRPQQFGEIVGQEAVATALGNALKSNRVAHAYLFTGARGVGKTSTARILAKALNCEKGPTTKPCGTCSLCVSITTGDDVDVLEIDGASNNGVERVREIRSNVQYLPTRARYKIYIIDEVHMLSTAAFNALLKTLEEPPSHVKFIFATTEVQKIPITILSRCQRFDFAGIGLPALVARLREIVAQENLEADDEALELVARRAGGSMRDAQSLLDQLLAFGNDRLTSEQVHSLLGTAGDDRVAELATAILSGKPAEALELLATLAEKSLQYGELVDQLMNYWRDLMVVHCSPENPRDLSVPSRHREALFVQAQTMSLDTILAGLDVLSTTRMRLKGTSQGRILVEMALVRLGRLEDMVALSQLTQWIREAPKDGSAPAIQVSGASSGAVKKKTPTSEVRSLSEEELSKPVALTAENVEVVWKSTLEQVGQFLRRYFSAANTPAISGPKTLEVSFPRDYNHQHSYCQEPERVRQVEEILQKITGEEWQIRVELSSEASANGQNGSSRPGLNNSESPLLRQRRLREEIQSVPLIERAIEVLGAEVRRVDLGFQIPDTNPVPAEDTHENVEDQPEPEEETE